MNLTEIIQEVKDRGYDFDSDPRITNWVNRAYHRLCDRHPWAWLETTATGAAPLTIADLRAVYSVADTTSDEILTVEDIRTLREADPGLDQTGAPAVWYLSGENTISVWPVRADTLSVRYIKVPTDLSGSATPILPTRYHYLLVEGALYYAYRDSDEPEMAQNCKDEFEEGIAEMAVATLAPNYDSLMSTVVYYNSSTDW